ncbi:MAG TPA: polysaccharide lyase family protein, partial [Fimbriimonadaceae bacterium]|nr:polysaccharide lyase family protein [Fimbriimonadaceae bacterium]
MIASIICAFAAVRGHAIWQIGNFDGTDTEFALAPGNYAAYRYDAAYVVGRSKPADWPYVLPGPEDPWAGSREHRASVFFGLKGVLRTSVPLTPSLSRNEPSAKRMVFVCDFVDSHYASPPRLALWVNGKKVASWQAPAGAGDASVFGHPEQGRHSEWSADVPESDLRNGLNELEIRDEQGSWVLFDALRLEGPATVNAEAVNPDLAVEPLDEDQIVLKTPEGPRQPIQLEVTNFGKPGQLSISGGVAWRGQVASGAQVVSVQIPPVKKPAQVNLRLDLGGVVTRQAVEIQPVRPWTVYLLPHSHVDIGYTDYQPVVEAMHRRNLFDAISVAKEFANYPPESRYRFNMEATWILDNLLRDGSKEELSEVANAFRTGTFDCSGDFCNVLTGLMRPEELMRSYGYSDRLRRWLGVDLTTATQTDVPGVTWGAVEAMSQAGIKNLVLMPNPSDRIGGVLRAWQDKPFWWVSPSGKAKVFVWEPASYGVAHGLRHFNGDRTNIFRTPDPTKNFIEGYVFPRLKELAGENYPYDCIAFPWSGTDNFPVDADVAPAARHWNETYVTPHVVVSTVSSACSAFLAKYRTKIPVERGDFTPYWEDGAGSSARETAMNRASADRLVQAEALAAMTRPASYDDKAFWEAWRNVILYSEHTWGAYNSVSEPDSDFAKKQWAYKQNFAVEADRLSRELLQASRPPASDAFAVINTTSWPRTDLVTIPAAESEAGDRVVDEHGKPIPSQRLKDGGLAVLAENVPAFGSIRLRVVAGKAYVRQTASATPGGLASPYWSIRIAQGTNRVDRLTSAISKLNIASGPIDQYLYLPGADLRNLKQATVKKVEVIEPGPLVARIRITSDAPGAHSLTQDIQVVAGLDRVDFTNVVDKIAIRDKEAVHFGFPFAVPGGQLRIQDSWAIVRPDLDQIPGSNKNWFTSQYFADVSNSRYGVTWASLDAPLMEVGGITARMLDGGFKSNQWIQHLGETQTIYSWALNNHWYTNYCADQSGPLTFRFSIRAHRAYDPAEAYRFGAGLAQPLLVGQSPDTQYPNTLLKVSDPHVVATALKPSEDEKALIVRLWNVGDKPARVKLT